MDKNLSLLAAGLMLAALAAGPARAADTNPPATPQGELAPPASQQEKMTACEGAASAKGIKGDARKAFMDQCVSRRGTIAATAKTQDTCADQAIQQNLTGAARDAFMKKCVGE